MIFLDTNILVYAALNQDPEKHRKAALIVRDLLADDNGAISAQVVSEFTNVMFKKTRRTADEIRALNTLFAPMLRLDMTISLVDRAISLKNGFGIQYYDALIVAAAEKLACEAGEIRTTLATAYAYPPAEGCLRSRCPSRGAVRDRWI